MASVICTALLNEGRQEDPALETRCGDAALKCDGGIE
jgi:hypothetical protein